jgi:hypothetical protein
MKDLILIQMHNRKLLFLLLSAVILALEGVSLGWSAYPDGQNLLAEHIFQTTFALYVSVLVVRSVGQCTTDLHSESMIHITVLTFFSSVLHLGAAILPSSCSISARILQAFPPSLAYWYSMTVLYTLTFAIYSTITCGPPSHFSPSLIYFQKSIDNVTI